MVKKEGESCSSSINCDVNLVCISGVCKRRFNYDDVCDATNYTQCQPNSYCVKVGSSAYY